MVARAYSGCMQVNVHSIAFSICKLRQGRACSGDCSMFARDPGNCRRACDAFESVRDSVVDLQSCPIGTSVLGDGPAISRPA